MSPDTAGTPETPGASETGQTPHGERPGSGFRHLRPFAYDPASEAWVPDGERPPADVDCLRVLTYNIWFSKHCRAERLAELLRVIESCRADVIGLQEVTPEQARGILAADWVRGEYQVSDAHGSTLSPHGVLLLSRLPLRRVAFCGLPSRKHRKLLLGTLALREGDLNIATVHMESSATSRLLRLAQIKHARSAQARAGAEDAILMGDLNFDPRQQAEQTRIDAAYVDLWSELRAGEPGYSVDTKRNGMRLLHKRGHKCARFDRILLRSPANRWQPQSIQLVGTDPVSGAPGTLFPSDHFGLLATLRRRAAPASSNCD
ncbi:MAG: endonuclease/exonuclease/phosphatase family protein [Thiohalocapsa sp.]|nr:endonuclease/exonuclease/phosphatase family protein [Thiohalocapsa sp.]MCF7992718.1 endonuclease/exonuclease/phosphatase family protein [Thiohalocapsa sp.]